MNGDNQTFVFKFQRGENLHRASFPSFPTYELLRSKINQQCSSQNYRIQWMDESGDRISISSQLDLDEYSNYLTATSQKYAKVIILEENLIRNMPENELEIEDEEIEDIEDMLGISDDESIDQLEKEKSASPSPLSPSSSSPLTGTVSMKMEPQVVEKLTKMNKKYTNKIQQHTETLEKLKSHRGFNQAEFDSKIELLKQMKLPYGVWMQKIIAYHIVHPERQKCEKKRTKVDEMVQKGIQIMRENGLPHGQQVHKILRNWAFNQVFFPTIPDETSKLMKELKLDLPPFVVNRIISKSNKQKRAKSLGNHR